MKLQPVTMAIIGCGNISSIYLQNCTTWPILDVVECADLDRQRAESQAAKFTIPRALAVEEVLADPSIEFVLNLTIPAAHGTIGLGALRAGKSVYNEKPLATAAMTRRSCSARRGSVGCGSVARPTRFWVVSCRPATS